MNVQVLCKGDDQTYLEGKKQHLSFSNQISVRFYLDILPKYFIFLEKQCFMVANLCSPPSYKQHAKF